MRRVTVIFLLYATTALAGPGFMPAYPTGEQAVGVTANLALDCGRFVAGVEAAAQSATEFAANVSTGFGGGVLCGFAIYPDNDGLAPIFSASGKNCASAGVISQTGLGPSTFVAGNTYRACFCAAQTGGTYYAPNWTITTGFALLQNIFVPSVGVAANPCGAGAVPPSSTGAITPNNGVKPPLFVLE